MVAMVPRSISLRGCSVRWPASRRTIVAAACRPDWIATCARPGKRSRLIRSPMTKTSEYPGCAVGFDLPAPGAVHLRTSRAGDNSSQRRGLDACGPDLRRRVYPLELRVVRLNVDATLIHTR